MRSLMVLLLVVSGCAAVRAQSKTGEQYTCVPYSENGDPKPAAKPGEVLTVER